MIRKATVKDIHAIRQIINSYAKEELMLARSLSELYEYVRSFYVYEDDGEIVGCCALQVVWENFAEIMSLAVKPEYKKQNIGTKLLTACIEDAYDLGVEKVFTLTYAPGFFEKNGFERIDKSVLPHKIWSGCIKCPKFPDCDEIALLKRLD